MKLEAETHLARRLQVSVLTLRQALSILAHEGLIERRQGSGTFVADHRKRKAVAICSSVYEGQSANSFQIRLFLLLAELFKRHGYPCRSYLAPCHTRHAFSELAEDVEQGRIAGAVFVAINADSVSVPLRKYAVPYLQWDGLRGSVGLDYVDLIHSGVRHLLRQGCRRVALLQWTGDMPRQEATLEAFRSTLKEHGAPIHDEWVRQMVPPEVPGAGWEQFREIWSARGEKPDGLLVTDDVLFRDVAMAMLDMQIQVPRQLQVVVHANRGSGVMYPFPVSLLEVDLNEWAEATMHRLIRLMNGEPVTSTVECIRARLVPGGAMRDGKRETISSEPQAR